MSPTSSAEGEVGSTPTVAAWALHQTNSKTEQATDRMKPRPLSSLASRKCVRTAPIAAKRTAIAINGSVARFTTSHLTMRLSDAGLRHRQTKMLYPNHRLPPWLTEDTTPRSLEPIVRGRTGRRPHRPVAGDRVLPTSAPAYRVRATPA